MSPPLFPAGYRASGLLLHVTSLPSRYGIGDVGPAAVAWVDRLHEARQSWWQALPLGPTGYGDSPYQSLSSFAGNPLLVNPDFAANTVVYTGTHDNPTTRGWYEDLPDAERRNLWRYVKRESGTSPDAAPALLGLAWSSASALAIAPLQDVLNLGREARINQPGTTEGNWRWRCTDEMLSASVFQSLRDLTTGSARSGDMEPPRADAPMAAAS